VTERPTRKERKDIVRGTAANFLCEIASGFYDVSRT
jgi:hypothetical protein